MNQLIYNGLLCLRSWGEADDILYLSTLERPLIEELEIIHKKKVTVRYWITDKQITKEEANNITALMAEGIVDANLWAQYSEITGYLYTDEELNIGGHNLLQELKSFIGKWVYLEIQMHVEGE